MSNTAVELTTISLPNMSVKYLVDFLSSQSWPASNADIYRSGLLLDEVLPKYGEEPEASKVPQPPPAPCVVSSNNPNLNGTPDWAKMTVDQANKFRVDVLKHNLDFAAWAATPVKDFQLTKGQLDTCQRAIKFFAPRTPTEREMDLNTTGQTRLEVPNNGYAYKLMRALKMAPEGETA